MDAKITNSNENKANPVNYSTQGFTGDPCFVGAAETAAPPDVCSKSVIRVSSVCSVEDDFCALKISQKKLWNPPPNPMQILYK